MLFVPGYIYSQMLSHERGVLVRTLSNSWELSPCSTLLDEPNGVADGKELDIDSTILHGSEVSRYVPVYLLGSHLGWAPPILGLHMLIKSRYGSTNSSRMQKRILIDITSEERRRRAIVPFREKVSYP